MYIIGSLFAVFIFIVSRELLHVEDHNLSLVTRNLGEGVEYLGMDFTKEKYMFAMPHGKEVDADKLQRILRGFLGKYVEVNFNKYLYVQIFEKELKKKYFLPSITRTNDNVMLGMGYHGVITHNFLKYPHMIIAGHTGYGKTELIRSMLPQLDGEVILIDMKPGDSVYPRITANNVDDARNVLEELVKELESRTKSTNHIYVIIDEAAELLPPEYLKKKEEKEPYLKCQEAIHKIARMGRSLKVHLIYATQYPTANIVPGQIKQNCETRIVFRLPTQVASGVALDEEGAERLPAGVPGRCIFKNDRKIEMQAFLTSDKVVDGSYVKIRDSKAERTTDIIEIG